jgi:hypothetical protein
VRVRPLSGCQVLESTPSADKKLDKLRSFVTCVCSNESCSMGRQMHLACFEDITRRLMLNVTLNKETALHSWLRQETNTKDGTRLLEFRANVSASDPLRLAKKIWQHSRESAILSICKCRCGVGHLRYDPDACASCAGAEPDVDETELKRREKQFAIEERSRQAKEEEAKRRNEEREKRRAASLLASLRHTEQALRAREEKAARERGQDVLASAFEPGKPWASMRAARPAASAAPGAPGAPKSLSSLSPVGSSTSPHTSERKGKCSGWSSSWSLDAPDEEARAFLWTPPASPTLFPSELAAMSSACASPTKVYRTPTQRVEDPRLAKLRADGDAAREARAKAERLKKEAEAAAAAEWTAKAAGGLPGNSGSSSTADAHFVKLRGLPYQINEQQISAFFQPLFVVAVQIAFSPSRQPSGFGYVQFRTPEDTTQALHRTNQVLGSRYVEIFRCTRAEMEQARMHALTVMPSPRGHGGAPPAGQRGGGAIQELERAHRPIWAAQPAKCAKARAREPGQQPLLTTACGCHDGCLPSSAQSELSKTDARAERAAKASATAEEPEREELEREEEELSAALRAIERREIAEALAEAAAAEASAAAEARRRQEDEAEEAMLQAALEASRVLAAQEARAREAVARWRRESDEQRRLERATQESLARAVVVEIEISPEVAAEIAISPEVAAAQDQEGRHRRHLVVEDADSNLDVYADYFPHEGVADAPAALSVAVLAASPESPQSVLSVIMGSGCSSLSPLEAIPPQPVPSIPSPIPGEVRPPCIHKQTIIEAVEAWLADGGGARAPATTPHMPTPRSPHVAGRGGRGGRGAGRGARDHGHA